MQVAIVDFNLARRNRIERAINLAWSTLLSETLPDELRRLLADAFLGDLTIHNAHGLNSKGESTSSLGWSFPGSGEIHLSTISLDEEKLAALILHETTHAVRPRPEGSEFHAELVEFARLPHKATAPTAPTAGDWPKFRARTNLVSGGPIRRSRWSEWNTHTGDIALITARAQSVIPHAHRAKWILPVTQRP